MRSLRAQLLLACALQALRTRTPTMKSPMAGLAADAHAKRIPGGTTQIGTLAEATCTLTSGSMTKSDVDATLRDTAPAAWSLLPVMDTGAKAGFRCAGRRGRLLRLNRDDAVPAGAMKENLRPRVFPTSLGGCASAGTTERDRGMWRPAAGDPLNH